MRTTPARPGLTDMPDGVGDTRWRVPFGNLEQSSGLVREPLCERNIGFALLPLAAASNCRAPRL